MFKDFETGNIITDSPEVRLPYTRKCSVSHQSAMAFSKTRINVRKLYMLLKAENERLRKPCSLCGTLVKPELQSQHNDAYHVKHAHQI